MLEKETVDFLPGRRRGPLSPVRHSDGVVRGRVKPMKFQDFVEAVRQVGAFWAVINEVPPGSVKQIAGVAS